MGDFREVYVTTYVTCTSPNGIFASSESPKQLKANGAVVAELADAPA